MLKISTYKNFEDVCIRYLLGLFDCLAHPTLGAPFATDQKWPICYLRISYQCLAGGLRSLQKSEFLKLIISFFHYFGVKIEISGTKCVEKTPIHIYLLLVQK